MIKTKKPSKTASPRDPSPRASNNTRKLTISLIASALLLGSSLTTAGAVSDALGLKAAKSAEMFPSDTTDFVSINLYSAAGAKSQPELIDTVKSMSVETQGGWKFVSDVSHDATTFIENRSALPWMGYETAKGTSGHHTTPATIYQVLNNDDAKKYMESEDCEKGFLKDSCHGKYIISSGWLITGAPEVLADYAEKPENSLAENETFVHDFAAAPDKPVMKIWTPAKTVSATLPKDFAEVGSQDGRIAAFMALNDSGFTLKANLHDSTNPYYVDLHNRGAINNDIKKLPSNSVIAVAGARADSIVGDMLAQDTSFINTHKEWTELRDAMARWKVNVPQDLPKIFGTNSALSINEGNSGNKVSGVLRVNDADENKIISLFSEAAKGNKDIINTYKIRKDNGDMVIESHDPITDGELGGSESFNKLIGDTSQSVAAAYVNLDKAHALLDSTYNIPPKGYDKGIIGINITSPSPSDVSITMNWMAK